MYVKDLGCDVSVFLLSFFYLTLDLGHQDSFVGIAFKVLT